MCDFYRVGKSKSGILCQQAFLFNAIEPAMTQQEKEYDDPET